MQADTLRCPSCGAPVAHRAGSAVAVCTYCQTPLQVRGEPGDVTVSEDTEIDAELVERIRALLSAGKRGEAIAAYRAATGADEGEAVEAVDGYGASLAAQVARAGTLNGKGWGIVAFGVAVLGLGVWFLAARVGATWLGGAIVAVGLLPLLVYASPALRSIRYLGASVGEATILREVYIGGRHGVHSYLLLLEVEAADGTTFETELPFPVGETGRAKIYEGRQFLVKYFPGRPESVLFYRQLDDG